MTDRHGTAPPARRLSLPGLWLVCGLLLPTASLADSHDCRHVQVTDADSGRPLAGIEDLVYHPPSDTLILSVHDRWGDADEDPNALMGLFGLALESLVAGGPATARRIAGPADRSMRPHGMSLAEREAGVWRLLVIDHRFYREEQRDGQPGTILQEYDVTGDGALAPLRQFGHAGLCPANDLDWDGGDRLIVTLDRANCGGFWRFLELARGQQRGRVVLVDLEAQTLTDLLTDLAFPNGIALDPASEGQFFLTESRAARLSRFSLDLDAEPSKGMSSETLQTVELPGAPDNLAFDADGMLLVALHPDVTDFGLYSMRVWGYESSATRIVRLSGTAPEAEVETILDDPDGALVSGATSVIQAGDHYVAGAAFDEGLVVCDLQ
ncbi:SMP-30/gluconolactonase/LRE family protein [Minwuia sp.]|uniref:SMP-30/gluconolactonase/LRE family protein n=1 Tax=Minwuia sp. TaxID=2493630 RepID=UPI003A8F883B